MALKLGILGIDHGHIFGMLSHMQQQGCTCDMYWDRWARCDRGKIQSGIPKGPKNAEPSPHFRRSKH